MCDTSPIHGILASVLDHAAAMKINTDSQNHGCKKKKKINKYLSNAYHEKNLCRVPKTLILF